MRCLMVFNSSKMSSADDSTQHCIPHNRGADDRVSDADTDLPRLHLDDGAQHGE